MKMLHCMLLVALLCALSALSAPRTGSGKPQPEMLELEGDISPIHDPAFIQEGDTYYLFASNRFAGKLLPIFCSEDLRRWKSCGSVFEGVPEWAVKEVPGAQGIWAPDIAYVRGEYRLYYSVSTFGSNRSVVGLATNKTLDPKRPDFRWVDRGKVVESRREDFWNAIDPNLAVDARGGMWLSWGSFWGGIKMRKLDPKTGKPSGRDSNLYSLAARPSEPPHAIEAPFIIRKGKLYYLFVSFDFCCRGANSTYKIMVGRSARITGPYRDRSGKSMMEGGGTLVLEGTPAWKGPGHPALLTGPKQDLLAFHTYHGGTGAPFLKISTLVWEDGWPKAGVLPDALETAVP